MSNSKFLILCAFAGLMLAACGGDGAGDASSLRKGGAQPQDTPAPQVQQVVVTRIVEVQGAGVPVEVTRIVPQEVLREVPVYVQVTATPDIAGFTAPACDPNVPQPTMALDAQDIASGVVLRGTSCQNGGK
jgi:hypothetical protein